MLDPAILRCPTCKATYAEKNQSAGDSPRCTGCDAEFPYVSGIPDLMPRDIAAQPEWSQWEQHLDAFARRRAVREERPRELTSRLTLSGGAQQLAFAKFTRISSGTVLDIGCGPGKFRNALPESITYIGLDPLPLPEVANIDFIRGIGEHLPFVDASIDHITVLSALDHFNDCEAFLREAKRVLTPDGGLHIIQQVHESIFSVRGIAHHIKDTLEDMKTRHDPDVPHHMTEFDDSTLRQCLSTEFRIEREETFSLKWYAPRRLFLTLRPR